MNADKVQRLSWCWSLVIHDFAAWYPNDDSREQIMEDMLARDQFDLDRDGEPVRPFNGRNTVLDLYHTLLDSVVLNRQALLETCTQGRIQQAPLLENIQRTLFILIKAVRRMLDEQAKPE